ncbi:type I restriction-modification system subunit M [Klebsiella quasipneumoniae]|uniref:site-specific DNA-methyltransferase (adenine-specific) n=4 Tax=Klebsiella pneumoniae complex TaxID=3390273 RepID=A0A8H9ZS62_9ENTR|nr:class I SAM-dependent DNA methyltransferase [Klebsiella quasipneumoniae]HBQ2884201.1 SAM-dependent DNA methyltransferase [Klebsiella quasipneumoniae subsp. quasipneumoniae]EIY5024175.1 SAM-dependent DNA methyltransferase [Klebsiella quasipneumoniae]EKZ5680034.1 SAM-dependent DNA methyltransferase [Klebsiella quasipneumoniae]EMF1933629.1 SAM-dependent DNA methyltransferase [Klebsiella quasipneumoniae]MBC4675265.1 SAM-dependent DNA methyltransferase [Klebsiella quasipneumoniae]
MDHSVHNKLISFIWNIADDCLRDVYVRGKYRDVILPMVVLRRLDTLLEPTKEAVLAEVKFQKEEMQATELDDEPLKAASGYVFYNTSKWTLKSLFNTATNNQQILLANFEEYLLGFSDNVKEIVECFNLKSQIRHMAAKQVLLDVVEKFVSPYINLTPEIVEDPDGNKMPALTNLGMGYVFEELIRKFNEENNEEAGEHFTPREVIELMTHLVFDPVKDQLPLTMTVYDPACGSGGMLTESQNFIEEKYPNDNRDIYLYGKEINDETYAICKSDMMIKGNNPENIKVGSTLSTDEFASSRFDFMLSNPPYGKSWASEQKHIKDGSDVIDPRFKVSLKDYWGNVEVVDATPRSSDGQLLFLMEMVNKMKDPSVSPHGSRIASVHNGSSLFTGDAGGGESNIRRFIIENDMLDAIVQLPNNLFYNTGITTYIWVLNNNKPASRKGKVQLIDASLLYRKLRKNLGNKNCEFAPEHITEITNTYLSCLDVERQLDTNNDPIGIASKVFSNDDFGYYKVTIERPDRRKARFTQDAIAALRFDKQFSDVMTHLYAEYGDDVYKNTGFGSDQKKSFLKSIEKEIFAWCEENEISLNAKARTKLLDVKHWLALRTVLETAQKLMSDIGVNEFDDFNEFVSLVDKSLKVSGVKLSVSEKNAILNAVSWYDESAEKVIKKIVKLSGDKLDDLLDRYECEVDDLPDFGYYPSGKKGEYITYETNADLRDTESVPLKQSIYQYFLEEVKPHISEAWINLDSVKIGYEISFNKYFYRHKPLRNLEEVAKDIIDLEQKSDGLIAQILGVKVAEVQGEV